MSINQLQPLISVIVPIFNAQEYLPICLMSLERQQYRNIEILLIDDGSTDHSVDICKKFCAKDNRFQYFYKTNGGLSTARNYGITNSNGKFICFIDSDDFCSKNFILTLYSSMLETKACIGVSSVVAIHGRKLIKSKAPDQKTVIDKYKFLSACLNLRSGSSYAATGGFACNKMFARQLIHDQRFPVIKGAEDELFLSQLLPRLSTIVYVPEAIYFYRQSLNSLSNRSDFFIHFLESRQSMLMSAANINAKKIYAAALYQALVEQYLVQIKHQNKLIKRRDTLLKIKEIFHYIISTESFNEFEKYLRKDVVSKRKFNMLFGSPISVFSLTTKFIYGLCGWRGTFQIVVLLNKFIDKCTAIHKNADSY